MIMTMITSNSEEERTDQNKNSAQGYFSQPLPAVGSNICNISDNKVEREQRSLALEKTYVYDVYEQIAPHFIENRHRPWPRIRQFLLDLEPGSMICDVGCGNGKYLEFNKEIFKIGSDQCYKLAEVVKKRHHEGVVCDNMALPFRDESFDAVLSIAVIHHFATTERRVQALRELARILRIGGRLIITVWALEQRHRKFESQDVLVPWHKPVLSSSEEQTSVDKEITSTTTSDDDILNYHAYTSGMESEPYFVPACCSKKKHRLRDGLVRYRTRNLESCQSSSQSSSDLSSPNETCYSFVRRALQKLSSSRTWDDPHQRCRPPWFLQSMDSAADGSDGCDCDAGCGSNAKNEKQDSLDSNENADDIPIELHDLDSEVYDESATAELPEALTADKRLQEVPSSANLRDSSGKSRSAKQLKRSSFTECTSPTMGHKSKSLSDILSLFTANFLSSRKTSQDSTSGSSSSSLTKQSSSSSVDSRTKSSRAFANHLKNGVVRSKSGHFMLAKVEEDNEQSLPQVPSSSPCLPQPASGKTSVQQRWSFTGYPLRATVQQSATDSAAGVKRPRSLVLGQELHIPRTLSAEDHKNGNTILPDLESCLTLYGLATGRKENGDFLSPPYMKAETADKAIASEAAIKVEEKAVQSGHANRLQDWTSWNETGVCGKTNCTVAPTHSSSRTGPVLTSDKSASKPFSSYDSACKKVEFFNKLSSLSVCEGSTWKNLFHANLIQQIIDREHLFPCRSMPDLRHWDMTSPSPNGSFQLLWEECPELGHSFAVDSSWKPDRSTGPSLKVDFLRNGFKKRSFSADVERSYTLANAGNRDFTSASGGSKTCCSIRRRSCVCACLAVDPQAIRHSLSSGDSSLQSLASRLSPSSSTAGVAQASIRVGGNKIIVKEDSLQSDTSVDSDDSVASVIAVRREGTVDLTSSVVPTTTSVRRCPQRLTSTCSKESSNHSDTSVDSEESCVSVIAVQPVKVTTEITGNECNSDGEGASANGTEGKTDCTWTEVDGVLYSSVSPTEEVDHPDDTAHNDFDSDLPSTSNGVVTAHPEDDESSTSRMKTSVSWEKYLDACESLVLDSIFYVNAAHSDYSGAIAHILPNVIEDFTEGVAIEYFDSEVPMVAEKCWLDSNSATGGDDEPEANGCLSSSEDRLEENLRLELLDEPRLPPQEVLPTSPQGRQLLEAAVDVANSLQSAVSAAVVVSTAKRKTSATNSAPSPYLHAVGSGGPGFTVMEELVPTLEMTTTVDIASPPPLEQGILLPPPLPFSSTGSTAPKLLETLRNGCHTYWNGELPVGSQLEDELDAEDLDTSGLDEDAGDDAVPTDVELLETPYEFQDDVFDEEGDDEAFMPDSTERAESAKRALEDSVCRMGTTASVTSENGPEAATPGDSGDSPADTCEGKLVDASSQSGEVAEEAVLPAELVIGDLKEGPLQEHHFRAREDVINGNVPGHRALLQKMIQEWGCNWMEYQDGGRTTGDGEQKCRRKSESEIVDWYMRRDSPNPYNAAPPLSRGRSMEFASSRRFLANAQSGCDKKLEGFAMSTKLSAGIQYQIQEEEESMSRSNESSELMDSIGAEHSKAASAATADTTDDGLSSSLKGSPCDKSKKTTAETDLMQTSMASSIENHFGNLEFILDGVGNEGGDGVASAADGAKIRGAALGSASPDDSGVIRNDDWEEEEDGPRRDSLSLSSSEDSILSGSENGGTATYHRYYHVFREGELDNLIEKYVENLHIISSYYDHSNWCIVAEKVQVWRI